MDLKLPGGEGEDADKPMIQEVGSTTFKAKKGLKKQASQPLPVVKPKFNWDTAEKVDA